MCLLGTDGSSSLYPPTPYPTVRFRDSIAANKLKKNPNETFAEPRSNIAGKVSKERFEGNRFTANGPAALLCPGQGFPIPRYE